MNAISFTPEAVIANVEAEGQILGALMLDNGLLPYVSGTLEPEHFTCPEHSEIYRIISTLSREGKLANPISLKPHLSFERVGDTPSGKYLLSLSVNPASAINIKDYAEQVVDLFLRRSMIQAVDEIRYTATQRGGPSTQAIIEEADQRFSSIRASSPFSEETPEGIEEINGHCIQHMADLMAGRIEPPPSTGLADLDRRIGGWGKGRFYVVGGRPAQGKTVFGINSLRRLVRQKKADGSRYGGMYFSLEVPYRDVWSRLMSSELSRGRTAVPYQDIQKAIGLTDAEAESVISASNNLSKYPIKIIDRAAMTVSQIEGKARETQRRWEKQGQSLDVVYVDYLGLIKASERYRGSKVNEIAEISASLLAMAKNLDIAVVALCQLSRGIENRESKIPNMADLRDSGAIEQDANSIVFITRPAYYAAQNGEEVMPGDEFKMIMNVDKARDGQPGLVHAFVDVANNCIEDEARS